MQFSPGELYCFDDELKPGLPCEKGFLLCNFWSGTNGIQIGCKFSVVSMVIFHISLCIIQDWFSIDLDVKHNACWHFNGETISETWVQEVLDNFVIMPLHLNKVYPSGWFGNLWLISFIQWFCISCCTLSWGFIFLIEVRKQRWILLHFEDRNLC